jgi:hypothetical protein
MINYGIIHDSVVFYQACGFERVESPWTVTEAVSNITKPEGKKEFALKHEDGKVLVASGEQSLLYLYLKGFLPPGSYQTTTPCFRKEAFNEFHTKYFVKTELMETKDVSERRLHEMIAIAKGFFARYFPERELLVQPDGGNSGGFDINYRGIELGSYGIRHCSYLEWIYATGVAEPRVSATLKKFEIERKHATV